MGFAPVLELGIGPLKLLVVVVDILIKITSSSVPQHQPKTGADEELHESQVKSVHTAPANVFRAEVLQA